MKIFLIIKHNSQRVKRKNFIKIKGIPLWQHFLKKLNSNDKVFVDTDSAEILKIGPKMFKNFFFYKRNQKFIEYENKGVKSPVLMMIRNFLKNHVEDENEIIVTPHVTSPFLKRSTIIKAAKFLGKYEFVHSVTEHNHFAWLKKNGNYKKINFGKVVKKTQSLDPIVFSNGGFFIFTKKNFLKYNNRIGKKNYFFNLKFPESLEIDTLNDLEILNKFI